MIFLQILIYWKPYRWQVWIPLVFSIPSVALVAWMVAKADPEPERHGNIYFADFINSFLYFFGAFFTQGRYFAFIEW